MEQIKIRAVGDNLIHKQLYEAARQDSGEYDFSSLFENIKDLLDEADISIINQETVLVDNEKDVGSFPNFGTPNAIGDAIVEAGFNVVTQATNHSLDKSTKGAEKTAQYWESTHPEVLLVGLHQNKEDRDKISILEIGGKKNCFSKLYASFKS